MLNVTDATIYLECYMYYNPYYHLQNQMEISMLLFQFTIHSHKKQIITYLVWYVVVFNKILKSNFYS